MNKRILFIPLDNRPCTMKLPVKTAMLAGVEMIHPPVEYLGRFQVPGDWRKVQDWLEAVPGPFDGAVISADMSLYGGLVASRTPRPGLEEILSRLDRLARILRGRRKELARIFISSSLLRTAPTYTDEALIPIIDDIIKYSSESFHLARGNEASARILTRLERAIPSHFLKQYLETRRRNKEVNLGLLRLLREGIADTLLFGIDDSKTTGINILEREDLEGQILEGGLGHKAHVVPGTDESSSLLLTRLLTEATGIAPSFMPVYSCERGKKTVPRYEDRSFEEIIRLHARVAGTPLASTPEEAGFILFAHVPDGCQKEAATQRFQLFMKDQVMMSASMIGSYVDDGMRVSLADVYYANGADRFLMEALAARVSLLELCGFAGWNTAGNTIGTAITHAAVLEIARSLAESEKERQRISRAHARLMLERIADDWLYQSEVRQDATIEALARGVSIFHLDSHLSYFKNLVQLALKKKIMEFFDSCAAACCRRNGLGKPRNIRIDLPWDRLFEVDVDVELQEFPTSTPREDPAGAGCIAPLEKTPR